MTTAVMYAPHVEQRNVLWLDHPLERGRPKLCEESNGVADARAGDLVFPSRGENVATAATGMLGCATPQAKNSVKAAKNERPHVVEALSQFLLRPRFRSWKNLTAVALTV